MIQLVRSEAPEGPRKKYTEEQLERATTRYDEAFDNWGWKENENVKRLFLARQMIARRLGFPVLQKLFTGKLASSKAQEDYEKGDHFLLKPFVTSLCSLAQAQQGADVSRVLDVLRTSSPAFDPQGVNAERTLSEMKVLASELTQSLSVRWNDSTLRDILRFCRDNDLCVIPDRLSDHLDRAPREEEYDPELYANDKGDWLADTFLNMKTVEIEPFVEFISENTPLSTQHGVKGEEYKDVLVVFDDIEASWNNYSFTKTLTPDTSGTPTDGQLERSRKLAYVCFSRAEENLRVLLFTPDPEAAKNELIANELFEDGQVSIVG